MKLLSLKESGPPDFGGLNNLKTQKTLRLRILVQTFHKLTYGNAEGKIQDRDLETRKDRWLTAVTPPPDIPQ